MGRARAGRIPGHECTMRVYMEINVWRGVWPLAGRGRYMHSHGAVRGRRYSGTIQRYRVLGAILYENKQNINENTTYPFEISGQASLDSFSATLGSLFTI